MYISILIPLFNGIEFIQECFESVEKQTNKKFEVIIGINGHPHNSETYKYASEYKSDIIRIIEYLDVKGKSKTLNMMVKDAKYDVICLLDIDDKWHPKKLEYQVKLKSKYDVLGTVCQYFGDNNIIPKIPLKEIDPDTFLTINPVVNSSCMLNKSDCKWRDHILEDYDLWLKLNHQNRTFYNIPYILTYHRIHDKSFFNNSNNDYVDDLRKEWMLKYKK